MRRSRPSALAALAGAGPLRRLCAGGLISLALATLAGVRATAQPAAGPSPAGAAPEAVASGAPPSAPTLTVVSFNVLHGGAFSGRSGRDEHLEERFALTVPALRALSPDIVGLQEASTSRERGNVAARLADALGFDHIYGSALFLLTPSAWLNHHIANFMNFTEGPAILSRFPIVEREVVKLPSCSGMFDPRILVHAQVATPWGRLPVFSTHISGLPCQSDAVARLIGERRGDLPGILMGDFNATEESPTIQRLTREAGFVDAFRLANPDAAGPTVWQPVTAPAPLARRRVDFVFLVPGRKHAGRVLESRVVLDQPGRRPDGTPLWPSDHYGVLARLALFPETAPAVAGPTE
jgi:endonuclease/exonuclease/phosphatase family metal-dependent hydrolase